MDNIDWSQYENDSIDFIYNESSKLLDETFKSFRESVNKSFVAFAIYSGAISYCLSKILDNYKNEKDSPYMLCLCGLLVAAGILVRNLVPGKMNIPGATPTSLTDSYFTHEDNLGVNQVREMKITRILDLDIAISENITLVKDRAHNFKVSVWIALATALLSVFWALR